MLEVKTNKGEIAIKVSGTMSDILTDIIIIISSVYENINNDKDKNTFERLLKEAITDEIYKKTNEEMDDLIKKNKKQLSLEELLKDIPFDVLKLIKDVLK